jgi:hypothetical protein
VAICLERGLEMVTALLAALKAGGAYLPLDPADPPERLAHLLADSGAAVLLAHGGALAGRALGLPILNPASDERQWAECSDHNPEAVETGLNDGNLAYIIYTSGSTGTPKGVMVEHTPTWRVCCRRPKTTSDSAPTTSGPYSIPMPLISRSGNCGAPWLTGAVSSSCHNSLRGHRRNSINYYVADR